MSDVVLRCPNCGTTQPRAGECEACHEADVRYYCPNHSPGRWLDEPRCAECDARRARERAAGPPPPRRTPTSRTPAARPPRRTPDAPDPFDDRPRRREEPSELDPDGEIEVPAGWRIEPPIRWPSRTPPEWRGGAAPPEIRLPRIPIFGCIGQLIKIAIFIFILFAMATCWFFSGGGLMIGEGENSARPLEEVVGTDVHIGVDEKPGT